MQCIAATKKGIRCQIQAEDCEDFCHVHHPRMTYRSQHPDMKVITYQELAISEFEFSKPGDDVPWKD